MQSMHLFIATNGAIIMTYHKSMSKRAREKLNYDIFTLHKGTHCRKVVIAVQKLEVEGKQAHTETYPS